MSRLAEIIDNHQNLDDFFSIIKHYGVSAEYLSKSIIRQIESESEGNEENSEENSEENTAYSQELVDDLKQFCARF